MAFKDVTEEQCQSNPYARLVPGQTIVEIPQYDLECGETLYNFPVAYKTWGKLNENGDNVLVICHALSGSSDVDDWWGELLGENKAFDPTKYFIICINFLGSPYGSCSPVTIDKSTGKPYGPSFPLVTFKDDVGIQKLILDSLNVKLLAAVIGGSMGGMLALEYLAIYNNTGYVKKVVALATAARTSAWCISWNETQRQCIFSDPYYDDGYYYETGNKPTSGLSAARMAALLTYRSRNSFENRFGRKLGVRKSSSASLSPDGENSGRSSPRPRSKQEEHSLLHNDGSKSVKGDATPVNEKYPPTYFSAQSYMRYNGSKFIDRFDANCYISISRKLDTNDLTRGRITNLEEHMNGHSNGHDSKDPLVEVLQGLSTPTLIIGIESDHLFTITEQRLLADNIPNSIFEKLDSEEGHDAFLLEFEKINTFITSFMSN